MNLNQEIQKATDVFIETKLPDIVASKVGKMVDEVIGNIFKTYSETGKAIKEKIEKALNVNLQEFDLLDYNQMVSKAVNDRLIGIVNEQSIKPIISLVESAVGFLEKKDWKISEIHELVIDEARQYYSWESSGEISFHVEEETTHEWYRINADIEKGKSPDKCSIEFLINKKGGYIFCFRMKDHWSRKDELTPSRVTRLSNLEHKIFRLYSAHVNVTVDDTDFDNEWYNND